MSITGASTTAEVEAEFDECSDYESPPSLARALRFIRAGTILLRRYATGMGSDGQYVQRDVRVLKETVLDARRWVAAAGAGVGDDGVIGADFGEFRE
jgi:hypothetical protein